MSERKPGRNLSLVFHAFLVVCALGLAYGFVRVGLGVLGEIPKLSSLPFRQTMIDVYLEVFLQRLVLAWVLWHVGRLGRRIARRQPFDPSVPSVVRRLAFAPAAWAVLGVLRDVYYSPVRPITPRDVLAYVYGDVGRNVLLMAVILMVARAFELATAMKRDADLTI